MKEIRRILADPSLEILSLKDAGIHADIDENGKSSMRAVVEQIQQTYELQVN